VIEGFFQSVRTFCSNRLCVRVHKLVSSRCASAPRVTSRHTVPENVTSRCSKEPCLADHNLKCRQRAERLNRDGVPPSPRAHGLCRYLDADASFTSDRFPLIKDRKILERDDHRQELTHSDRDTTIRVLQRGVPLATGCNFVMPLACRSTFETSLCAAKRRSG
jgi:hypothetical protein